MDFLSLLIALLISALAVWSLVRVQRGFSRLQREKEVLASLEGTLIPSNSSALRLVRSEVENLAVGSAIKTAIQPGIAGAEVGDLAILEEEIQWPRYWAGLFVFIGLFGTVGGVAMAVSGLGGALGDRGADSVTSFDQLQGQIAGLLSHLRSAFYCTLAGLFWTIILSFSTASYLASLRTLEEQLARFAGRLSVVWARSRSEEETTERKAQAAEEAQRQAEDRQQMVTLWGKVTDVIGELKIATTHLGDSLLPASKIVAETTQQAKEIAQSLNVAAHSLDEVSGKLEVPLTGITSKLAEIETAAAKLDGSVINGNAQLEAAAKTLEESVSILNTSTRELSAERESLIGIGVIAQQSARDMASSQDATRTVLENSLEVFRERLETLALGVGEHQQAAITALRGAFEQNLRELLTRTDDQLKAWQESLQTSQTEQEKHLSAAQAAFTKTLAETTTAWQWELGEKMQEVLGELSQNSETWRGQTIQSQTELRRLTETLLKNFELTLTQLRDEHDAAQENQRDALAKTGASIQRSERDLRTLLHSFERTLAEVAALSEAPTLRQQVLDVRNSLLEGVKAQAEQATTLEQEVAQLLAKVRKLETDLRQELRGQTTQVSSQEGRVSRLIEQMQGLETQIRTATTKPDGWRPQLETDVWEKQARRSPQSSVLPTDASEHFVSDEGKGMQ